MDFRPRVICGFPGVGKTTLFKKLRAEGILITDSDSSQFNKDQFPQNYIEHIQACLASGAWVLCSTHKVVREALQAAGISYVLAVPVHKYLKDEYMERYRQRGSPEAFLKLMDEKFDEFVFDVWADKSGLHFGLGEGEYLDRLGKDIVASSNSMRRLKFPHSDQIGVPVVVGHPNESMEFASGFQLGVIYMEICAAINQDMFGRRTYAILTKYVESAKQLAVQMNILFEAKQTMNPQVTTVQFYKDLEAYKYAKRISAAVPEEEPLVVTMRAELAQLVADQKSGKVLSGVSSHVLPMRLHSITEDLAREFGLVLSVGHIAGTTTFVAKFFSGIVEEGSAT